jgi:hypothetical protein
MNSSDKIARKKFTTILQNGSVIEPILSSGFYTLCKSNSLDSTLDTCIYELLCPKINIRSDAYVNIPSNKYIALYSKTNTITCCERKYVTNPRLQFIET